MQSVNVFMLLTPKANVSFLFSGETLETALGKLRATGYMSIPVLEEDGKYLGSVREGDFLWNMVDNGCDIADLAKTKVSQIINKNYNTAVRVDIKMNELIERVLNQNYVPVIDDRDYFIGIVTRREVMGYLMKKVNA